ncbi:hypothetical protein GCM10007036_15000 [Alsobacter metallidurans]|uniref:Uncharacterized protein n=1 Tax=Alsobacter metallidurans TaxID=340221 RepID=A0A917I632_9HYPH|nr:hypothetical protein GCM10007036_15000 [Alsobacter metallidurans]
MFGRSVMRMLAMLAAIGLFLAPLSGARAAPWSPADVTATMDDGMPCCPPAKPVPPDCQKGCPLAAFCFAKSAATPSKGPEARTASLRAAIIRPLDDPRLDGPLQGPPLRPPQS